MNEKSFPINVTMWYDDYEERITKEQVNIDYDGIKGVFQYLIYVTALKMLS